MKKLLILLIVPVILFSACTGTAADDADGRLRIISTIFPGYDFARQVCGDNAVVTQLLPPGGEAHSFEPTPQDIIAIQNCDLFIYVGGESDTWVDMILESLAEPVRTVRMMDCVEAVAEEIKEGMETEHGGDAGEYDEHVWTSPKNAVLITQAIASAVVEADPGSKDMYEKNAADYTEALNRLDKSFSDFFESVEKKTLIVGDRFPLRYFTDAYGLDYYAAFPGCSGETEPSAATIAFLIDKIKQLGITTVFYMEFSNHVIADGIAEATGCATAMLSACHNVTKADRDGGATYISLMERNLETFREAMK